MVKLNSLGKLNKAFHNFDIPGLYYNIANHQNKSREELSMYLVRITNCSNEQKNNENINTDTDDR